jgi:uncharacterized protein (DUF1810 family)
MNPPNPADPFDLARFTQAQDPSWAAVCQELRAGHKQTHWMWFVFPQLAALGRSAMARHYGLSGMEEAKAYAAHPVLGARLREVCQLLLTHADRSATEIFGPVDAMKLRSCLTLFAAASPQDEVFTQCLQRYFAGEPDPLTLEHLR